MSDNSEKRLEKADFQPEEDTTTLALPSGAPDPRTEELQLSPDTDVPFHPETEDFPIIQRHVDQLAESIAAFGQLEPGLIYVDQDGQEWLVGGRHRRIAAQQLKVPFRCRRDTRLPGGLSPRDYIDAEFNLPEKSKTMSYVERAIGAARRSFTYEKEATQRQLAFQEASGDEAGRSFEKAARVFGVAGNAVRQAREVIKSAHAMKLVLEEKLTLTTAARIVKRTEDLPVKDRERALCAAAKGDLETVNELIGASRRSSLRLGDEEAALVAKWEKQLKVIAAFKDWHASVVNSEVGRLLGPVLSERAVAKLYERLRDSQPYRTCRWCPEDGACQQCEGRKWLTKIEYDRIEEAERQANLRLLKPIRA